MQNPDTTPDPDVPDPGGNDGGTVSSSPPAEAPATIQDHLDHQAETEESAALAQWNTPDDVPADRSTGYAVYDRTVGQYLPGVEKDKPTKAAAEKRVPKGHVAAVVRV